MAPPGGAGALRGSGQGRGGRSEWKEIGLACAGALSAGAGALAVYYRMNLSKPRDGDRPRVGSWTRRSLQSSEVKPGLEGFTQHFEHQRSPGAGAGFDAYKKAMDTPSFVDTFYDLVTDFYEYGWGQSFHFAPRKRGESFNQSLEHHERRIGEEVGLKQGMHGLDVGCGVGGPMRVIARHSGAQLTGITINEYQVKRANEHNRRMGLSEQCTVVQGTFLEMPFEENTFDAAVCIESACHSPSQRDIYKQVYNVLKPGAHFASYEWLTTENYDPKNKEHVDTIADINEGNALPGIRTIEDVRKAAKEVGFEVEKAVNVAKEAEVPWQRAMKSARMSAYVTHMITWAMEKVRCAPKGTLAVHELLLKAAVALEKAGDLDIFTPMYLVVLKKPSS